MSKFLRLMAVALLAMAAVSTTSYAQGGGGGGAGGGGGQGGGGGRGQGGRGGDPAMMATNMKANITATDDEWKVIEPLLVTVLTKRNSPVLQGGRGGRGGGRGGNGGGGAAPAPAPGAEDIAALRTLAEDTASKPEDIKAKLTALRDARKKANDELKASREALTKVLNVRQEAQFVLSGVLE